MNVVLYMAVTADGFIAKENDEVDFITEKGWKRFRDMVAETGNIVIGRRTYEIMKEAGDFSGLEQVRTVIVSDGANINLLSDNHTLVASPEDALDLLKQKGFSQVLVGGGGTLNGSFIKEGLIDEIILDIDPVLLGKGIRLFGNSEIDCKLKLISLKQFSESEVQAHYQVSSTRPQLDSV